MYSQSFMWKFARSNTVGSFSKLSESLACGKSQVELLIHPQRERLPQFKIRILMINKVEPTVVIPTEGRLMESPGLFGRFNVCFCARLFHDFFFR
jgi:hypothetical protein